MYGFIAVHNINISMHKECDKKYRCVCVCVSVCVFKILSFTKEQLQIINKAKLSND